MENTPVKVRAKKTNSKGLVLQARFAKFFLSERINGKLNPYYGKATAAAIKAGYSEGYAKKILSEIKKQDTDLSGEINNLSKSLKTSLNKAGVNGDKLTGLLIKLLDKPDLAINLRNGKVIETKHPDSHAARVALDFIAKTQDLYASERIKITNELDGLSKEELTEYVLRRITGSGRRSESAGGKG